ncbi:MAG: HAMP domain-containing sensor histidine kinase [Chitinophagaceae bacterium]
MPVRLRITFLFTLVVFIILGVVCGSIYFFSYQSRLAIIKTRLTNRALTTARLLSQSEIFDRELVARIDSLTTISLKNKSVEAYNYLNKRIYNYSDVPEDTLHITDEILDDARVRQRFYFTDGDKEVIAYHYTNNNARIVVICAAEDEDGLKNLAQLKYILLLSFIAGICIALIGGYFFSSGLLQPIKKITEEVTEISAQNLTRRIQTGRSKDEWYQMSVTLNDLLNRLQESFELQRRFISNASHELSTPLTAISTQLEIALQRERSIAQYEKVISDVLQDVQHMNKLTMTLLEFAKAAGNKGGLNIDLVRIDEILMELPSICRKLNSGYEVSLRFDELPESEDELLVFGNAELLSTAIKNVIINACKYSADHRAEIRLVIRDRNFIISIKDNGSGIPATEISNIFQPFYRIDNARTTQGFGLGLSLAHRIIKLHKGEIDVVSVLDEGTVFTIKLPSAGTIDSNIILMRD